MFVFVQPAQVQLHLDNMRRLEGRQIQFDGNRPAPAAMEEELVWILQSFVVEHNGFVDEKSYYLCDNPGLFPMARALTAN